METTKPPQKTILAIEDEVEILNIIKTVLEGEGYRVYATTSPLEGVYIYRQHWPSIALVLSDFHMPELTGEEVFKQLWCINPNVAMLLVSGSRDYLPSGFLELGIRGLVRKPFHLDELILRVKEAIEKTAQQGNMPETTKRERRK